jgi:hypothetical protein
VVRNKKYETDTNFRTSNVRSLCSSDLFTAATGELTRYTLDLLDVQKVRWGKLGHGKSRGYIFFFCVRGNEKCQLGSALFVHNRLVSAFRRVEKLTLLHNS